MKNLGKLKHEIQVMGYDSTAMRNNCAVDIYVVKKEPSQKINMGIVCPFTDEQNRRQMVTTTYRITNVNYSRIISRVVLV